VQPCLGGLPELGVVPVGGAVAQMWGREQLVLLAEGGCTGAVHQTSGLRLIDDSQHSQQGCLPAKLVLPCPCLALGKYTTYAAN
jgi:hypothetical protein